MTATATGAWNDLLAGEEPAYLGNEPAREARTVPLPTDVHPRLREALTGLGIEALFEHQAQTWAAARRGEYVILMNGTLSGNTHAIKCHVLNGIDRE